MIRTLILPNHLRQVGPILTIALLALIPISTALVTICLVLLGLCLIAQGDWTLNYKHLKNPFAVWTFAISALVILQLGPGSEFKSSLTFVAKLLICWGAMKYCNAPLVKKWAMPTLSASIIVCGLISLMGSKLALKSYIDANLLMAFAFFYFLLRVFEKKETLSLALALFCVVYVFFLCKGRIGYPIVGSFMLYLCYQRFGFRGLLVSSLGFGLLVSFAYYFSPLFADRIGHLFSDVQAIQSGTYSETSLGQRYDFVYLSWKAVLAHPWFGWGSGTFGSAYQSVAIEFGNEVTKNPHNSYLFVLVEHGIAGLSLFLGLLVYLWGAARQLSIEEKCLAQGILLSFIIGGFFNTWLIDFTPSILFHMILALCFSNYKLDTHD